YEVGPISAPRRFGAEVELFIDRCCNSPDFRAIKDWLARSSSQQRTIETVLAIAKSSISFQSLHLPINMVDTDVGRIDVMGAINIRENVCDRTHFCHIIHMGGGARLKSGNVLRRSVNWQIDNEARETSSAIARILSIERHDNM